MWLKNTVLSIFLFCFLLLLYQLILLTCFSLNLSSHFLLFFCDCFSSLLLLFLDLLSFSISSMLVWKLRPPFCYIITVRVCSSARLPPRTWCTAIRSKCLRPLFSRGVFTLPPKYLSSLVGVTYYSFFAPLSFLPRPTFHL